MVKDYKVVPFITAPGQADEPSAGWSETWYTQASSVTEAANLIEPFLRERFKLLCGPVIWKAYRVTELGSNRISQLFPIASFDSFTPGNGLADKNEVCALISCRTGVSFHRSWYCGGVPDDLYTRGTQTVIYQLWYDAWQAFRAQVQNNDFPVYMRVLDRVSNPQMKIISFVYDKPNEKLTINVEGIMAIAPNENVRVYAATGWNPDIGTRLVQKVTAVGGNTEIEVQYDGRLGDDPSPKTKAMRAVYGLFRIQFMSWLRSTTRDRGRPFDQRRGRR